MPRAAVNNLKINVLQLTLRPCPLIYLLAVSPWEECNSPLTARPVDGIARHGMVTWAPDTGASRIILFTGLTMLDQLISLGEQLSVFNNRPLSEIVSRNDRLATDL
jgi:hypothetical protein